MEKIVDLKRNLEDVAAKNEMAEEESGLDEVPLMVDKLATDVEEAIDAVKAEDDSRELYTLDTAKTETVKLPTFQGRDD